MSHQDPFFEYLDSPKKQLDQNLFKRGSAFKVYERFHQIPLSRDVLPAIALSEVLKRRRSERTYSESTCVSLSQVGQLLFWGAGLCNAQSAFHRGYPSGGAKYPLEVYIVALRCQGLARGVYHYNVQKHVLEVLTHVDADQVEGLLSLSDSGIRNTNVVVLMSFIKQRSFDKYGMLAYKLALLEGGHLGQSLYLVAASLSIGCCALGVSKNAEALNRAVSLDGLNETFFYGLAVGPVNT